MSGVLAAYALILAAEGGPVPTELMNDPAFLAALGVNDQPGPANSLLEDRLGDAVIRRTDPGANGVLGPQAAPDLLSATATGWSSPTPATDPYAGTPEDASTALLLRLDVVFEGLACPPGTLGMNGLPFHPHRFGSRATYGFLEIDMDADPDTGGELGGHAASRPLANIGRFGEKPGGLMGARALEFGEQADGDFFTAPFFERSGSDFALTLCGCSSLSVVSRPVGNSNDTFEAGEVWLVRGRFFQRSGGYRAASAAYGGSSIGAYDPLVTLRYAHDVATDRTTVTLVWALRHAGAGLLAGQPAQPIDLDVSNHASVEEAMRDVIDGVNAGGLTGASLVLSQGWAGQQPSRAFGVGSWRMLGLFGVAYAQQEPTLYAWTDAGGQARYGDFDADGVVTTADAGVWSSALSANDGSARDCDGSVNGTVTLCDPGTRWSVFDLGSDGLISAADAGLLRPCPGDANRDWTVNFLDLNQILADFGRRGAGLPSDVNGDGEVNFLDLNLSLVNLNAVC